MRYLSYTDWKTRLSMVLETKDDVDITLFPEEKLRELWEHEYEVREAAKSLIDEFL